MIVIYKIQGTLHQLIANPLLHDIWSMLRLAATVSIQHVYQEMNSMIDWIAFFVTQYLYE